MRRLVVAWLTMILAAAGAAAQESTATPLTTALLDQPPAPPTAAPPKSAAPAPKAPAPTPARPQPPQRTIPEPTPEDARQAVQPQDFNNNNLNNPVGLAAGPQSSSPAMIGDLFGSTSTPSIVPMFTPATAGNLFIINSNFPTGGPPVPVGFYGFAPTQTPPVPYFLSNGPVTPPNPVIGQVVPLAPNQPNINADLTAPNPPGSSTLQIANGSAVVTSLLTGPIGLLGTADANYTVVTSIGVDIPNPGGGGSVGNQKIMEGNSPQPRDRIFSFYDYFQNVPLAPGGVNVNRLTPGFEKTFFDQLMSIEVRMPMALTLDSNITPGMTQMSHGEFGNMMIAYKALLYQDRTWLFSGGTGIAAPTADDVNVFLPGNIPLVTIQNRSTHVMPYLGSLWTPNSAWYLQSFVQVDVDTNGSPVLANLGGTGLTPIGRLQCPTYLYASTGVGRWLVRNNRGFLTGLALLGEVHYNRSLQASDTIVSGPFTIGDFSQNFELLNLTFGTTWQFRNRGYLTTAFCTPVGSGADRQFDGQFRLMYNRRFGPNLSPATN